MNDLVVLGLVVLALYLGECAWWVRHGAAVVAAPFYFGGGRVRVLSRALGNARGAFALLNPLPPFGRAYVVEPWPFSVSAGGVLAARSFSFAHEPRPAPSATCVAWDAVERVGSEDATLTVNGAPFSTCASRHHARAAAAALEAVRAAKPKDRKRVIDQQIEAHLDAARAAQQLKKHRSRGLAPAIGALGLFVLLFLEVPREVAARGLERWPLLVALLYAWVLLIAGSTYVAHRMLHGGKPTETATRGERWQQILLMFPAPYTALRTNDKLGRNLLAGLHPLAAALAQPKPAVRDDVVGRALRDLRTPRPLPLEGEAAAVEAAFRERVLHVATRLAKDRGVDVEAAFAPPELKAGQVAFCARCRQPYRATGTCADCGVPLTERAA